MARRKALSPAKEQAAREMLSAGSSAREIARKFGVDHKTITKVGKSSPPTRQPRLEVKPSTDAIVITDASSSDDDFEAAQLETYRTLRKLIQAAAEPRESAFSGGEFTIDSRGLAGLVKAQNDTIKAIRLGRLTRRPESDDAVDAASERVIARLQRLSQRSAPIVEISEPVEDASNEVAQGTDG